MPDSTHPAHPSLLKTTGLGFFRAGTSPIKTRQRGLDSMGTESSTSDPSTSSRGALQIPDQQAEVSRKRSTRIPFLGRVRKKSNASGLSQVESELEETDNETQSFQVLRPKAAAPATTGDEPPSTHEGHMHTPTSIPSLGAKIAARFSKLPGTKLSAQANRSSTQSTATSSDKLLPPTPTPRSRTSSLNSNASRASRSSTPRILRPPANLSQQNLDEFEDLFTKPRLHPESLEVPTSRPMEHNHSSPASSISVQDFPTVHNEEKIEPSSHSPSNRGKSSRPFPIHPPDTTTKVRTPSLRSPSIIDSPLKPPPTIPLPQTPQPTSGNSSSSSQSTIGHRRGSASGSTWNCPRPRAQTFTSATSSVQPSQVGSSNILQRKHNKGSSSEKSVLEAQLNKENIDKVNGQIDQLRQTLEKKNSEFEDLKAYLSKITEKHAAEKSLLEKRIAMLEKENARKDKEIKGLRWLVVNNRPPSSNGGTDTGTLSDSATKSLSDLSKGQSVTKTALKSSLRAPVYGKASLAIDDLQISGAETSGTESTSSHPMRKPVRRTKISKPTAVRPAAPQSVPGDSTVPNDLLSVSSGKRSSLSSFTSSVSSHSSLPSTHSSALSAIPESPPPPLPIPTNLPPSRDPALAAAQLSVGKVREKEAMKANRAAHRVSAPTTTSIPTPAAMYAANLRKGRPPSIAQVLNQTVEVNNKAAAKV